MLRRFSINFAILSMILDGLTVELSLSFAVLVRPAMNHLSFIEFIAEPVTLPAALYVLFPLIYLIVLAAFAIYDGRKYLRVADEFGALLLGNLIAAVSSAGILYLSYRQVSRSLFILFVILVTLLSLGWRVLARIFFRLQKAQPARLRRVLVVGSGPLGQRVSSQLQQADPQTMTFIGFVDDVKDPQPSSGWIGRMDQVGELVPDRQVSDVVIALPYSAYSQLGDIVRRIEKLPVNVWVALGFFDLALYNTAIEDFAGIPMLDLRASAIDDYQRLVKRIFDIFFGFLALLISLPVLGLISLGILLDDGRPILFRQKRVGENGRVFEMLKFRTMVRNAEELQNKVVKHDADGNIIHKTEDDPRVTRFGRFLRHSSLDELPQLINVLRGDMSLVGPRPEMPYLVEQYQPWQRKRFAIPPGMTGWWQVSGRSDKPMHLHTEDDLYYLNHYSILLDIQILIKTAWVVLLGKGAY